MTDSFQENQNLELTNEVIEKAIEKSASVVLEFQHESGAYPASPNFKVYSYSWFRDGAFIADGMSRQVMWNQQKNSLLGALM